MGIYVTRDDLLATDAERVWNMAINKATGQLDEEKIQRAIDDTDAEINSFLAKRYHLPLNLPHSRVRYVVRRSPSRSTGCLIATARLPTRSRNATTMPCDAP
jgi:phage gp36-like protein